jgi:ankyrin repeat protein
MEMELHLKGTTKCNLTPMSHVQLPNRSNHQTKSHISFFQCLQDSEGTIIEPISESTSFEMPQIDLLCSLQAELTSLQDNGPMDAAVVKRLETEFGIETIAHEIVRTTSIRPADIPALAKFAAFLCADQALVELKPALAKSFLRCFSCSDPFPNEAGSFAFLFQAFDHRLFTADEILTLVRQTASNPRFLQSAYWFLVYFGPELEAADPALTANLIKRMQLNSSRKRLPHVFAVFSDEFERYRSDDWAIIRAYRNFFREFPGVASGIFEDNAAALEAFVASADVSVLKRLPTWACFPSPTLLRRPTLIQTAALFGSVNCFRWLLSNGSDIYASDKGFMTLAQAAVAGGNLEIVRICQQYQLDFSSTAEVAIKYHRDELFDWLYVQNYQHIGNLLRTACECGNLRALHRLASRADINSVSSDGRWTALTLAVWRENHSCIRFLLSLPAIDPDLLDPLALAVERGDVGAARLLLDGGTRVTGAPYLEIAVRNRHFAMVEFLLTLSSIDPNARTPGSVSPFVRAVRSGQEAIALALSGDQRVDVNNSFTDTVGPLFWAIRHGTLSLVEALLARPDLDLSARTPMGCTFLHVAAQKGSMLPFLLNRCDVDVNARDLSGKTALHKAVFTGNIVAVAALLSHASTDVNAVSERGTPLAYAFARRQRDIALALIECERVRTDGHPRAITHAIWCGFTDCVRLLSARNDCDVGSALTVAAGRGCAEMVAILLARSPPRYRTKRALSIATRLGFTDCAQLLKTSLKLERGPGKIGCCLRDGGLGECI